MSYQILNADGTLLLTLSDDIVDQTTTSLALVGNDVAEYGPYIVQNFIQLLENFASANPPIAPQSGQLWYNKTSTVLSVYVSAEWVALATQTWVENFDYITQSNLTAYNYATQTYVQQEIASISASITLSGIPVAPTATLGTNNTQVATTAFVDNAITAENVPYTLTVTGDVSGTTQYGTANESFALTLANTGVTPGTYNSVVVDAKGRVIVGQTIAGSGSSGATLTTPPQFDSSVSAATTAFVQRALGNFQSALNVANNVPTSISSAYFGYFLTITSSTSVTFSTALPTASIPGGAFLIFNNSSALQIITTSTSKFYGPFGTGTNTVNIFAGEILLFVADGTNYSITANNMRTSVGPSTWTYTPQIGQPSYVWGTADGQNMSVYNPANFTVASAATAASIPWNGVVGAPTDLSSFTNGPGYIIGGIRTATGIAIGTPTGNCGNCGTVSTGNCTTYLTLTTTGNFSMTYDVVNCS